jgi:molecular chaperone DnaK
LKEQGDKVDDGLKQSVQSEIDKLKKALESDDVSQIKQGVERLTEEMHKVAQKIYQQPGAGPMPGAGPFPGGVPPGGVPGGAGPQEPASGAPADENVVDADYEIVDEDEEENK